jgi:hypothetical protein
LPKKLFCQMITTLLISVILLSSACIFPVHAQTNSSNISYPKDGEVTYANYNSSFMPWTRKEAIIPLWIDFANENGGTYESIGKSSAPQQWDIVAFKFGNPNKPAIMVNAYLHGNEQYGYEVLYALAKWLVSSDAAAKSILENNYVIFIPVVDYRWARTNYNYQNVPEPYIDVDDNKSSAVDLNRNFSPSWSNALFEQQYSGTSPDSEPESQALINAWTKYQPRFYWTLHHGSTRIYTEAIATTDQQKEDINKLKDLLPGIAEDVGISSGSMFKIYVQTEFGECYGGSGKGYAIDGASSHGAAGIITELKTSWISTVNVQADLNSGDTFKQAKAFFITMATTISAQSTPSSPTQSSSSSESETSNPPGSSPAPSGEEGTTPSEQTSPDTSQEASPFETGNLTLIAAAVIIVIAAIAGVGAAVNLKRRKRKPV